MVRDTSKELRESYSKKYHHTAALFDILDTIAKSAQISGTVAILNLTLSRRSANVGFNYTLSENALNGRVLFEYLFTSCKAQMFLQRF